MMGDAQAILSSTVSGAVRLAVFMLVAFVLTPKIIRTTGAEQFGLWALVMSVVGLFEWLDIGFFPAVVKTVAESRARPDAARRNRVLSTIFVAYQVLALAGTTALAVVALNFDRWFEIPAPLRSEAMWLVAILTVRSVLFGLPLSIFRAILFGDRRIPLLNVTSAAFMLLYGAAGWFALDAGWGIVGLAVVNVSASLLEALVHACLCARSLPDLDLAWSLFDRRVIADISGLNLTQLAASVSSLLVQRAGPIIVQLGAGLAYVSLYTVASRIVGYLYLLPKQFSDSLSPTIVHLAACGRGDDLRSLIVTSMKVTTALGAVCAVSGVLFGGPLITCWVGDAFARSVSVLAVLLAAMLVAAFGFVAYEALVMTGHHCLLIRYFALEVVVNVSVSAALVEPLGMIGVALGTLAAGVVVTPLVVRRLCAIHGIAAGRLVREVITPLLVPVLGQATMASVILASAPPSSVLMVLVENVPCVLLFAALFWRCGATHRERTLIVRCLPARLVRSCLTEEARHAS